MPEPFITYKVFNDPELAKEFAEVLDKNAIPYLVEEDGYNFDPSYANHPLNKDYRLKLRQRDFVTANQVFSDFFKDLIESVEKDYYLFEFSDTELLEILIKPDEWGDLDYQLAQKILKDRGKEIQPVQLEDFKKKRLEELKKPEKTEYTSIIIGYLLAVFISPVAIFLGYMMAYSKKTLPNGQIVFAYSNTQKFHGQIILILSSSLTAFAILGILFF